METKITATELARSLSDVLNRVKYKGERFIVERNGETVATIVPTELLKTSTLGDFLEFIAETPWPDPDFGKDIEAAIAAQGKATFPEWPS